MLCQTCHQGVFDVSCIVITVYRAKTILLAIMSEKQILIWTGSDDEALCMVVDKLEGACSNRASDRADALAKMPHADAFVVSAAMWNSEFADAIAMSPQLTWIQVINAGFDNIESMGVPGHVTISTSGPVGATVVAEHALMLLLALIHKLPAAVDAQRRSEWLFPTLASGVTTLHGKEVTVVGFGPIGRAIVSLATTFGAKVTAVTKTARVGVETYDDLPSLLKRTDALVIAAPLTKITQHMINRSVFSQMKSGACLVNVSRGRIIDTDALVDALDSGVLAGAALDVTDPEPLPPEHPLWAQPNVIITPHIAWAGDGHDVRKQLEEVVVENVRRFVLGEKIHYIAPIEYT